MNGRHWIDPQDKYFEEFNTGDRLTTRGRTLDVADFTAFAGLTGDHYPLHTDEDYAKATRFKARIAHGPLTFAIAVGLVGMSGFYGNAIVALLEVQSLKALKPVFAGDTVRVQAEVVDAVAGENPKFGVLHVKYSVLNQRQEEVMAFMQIMLARRRTPGSEQ